jgi:hypothetical protein
MKHPRVFRTRGCYLLMKGGDTIANRNYTKPPTRTQLLAALVTLTSLLVALRLHLQGAELAAVLVAALAVGLALARKR